MSSHCGSRGICRKKLFAPCLHSAYTCQSSRPADELIACSNTSKTKMSEKVIFFSVAHVHLVEASKPIQFHTVHGLHTLGHMLNQFTGRCCQRFCQDAPPLGEVECTLNLRHISCNFFWIVWKGELALHVWLYRRQLLRIKDVDGDLGWSWQGEKTTIKLSHRLRRVLKWPKNHSTK